MTDETREPEEEEPEAPDDAEPPPDPESVSGDVVVPANAAMAADVLAGTDRTD